MPVIIEKNALNALKNADATGLKASKLAKVELWDGSRLIKELPVVGVRVVEPGKIYVVATDSSVDAYTVNKLKYYLDNDVLFAT
ncbi:MAG: hypothetical protein V6Z81_10685, partial [Parvularculales bacterium]